MKLSESPFGGLSVRETSDYDVIVCGGGPAGCAAAASAAREGARTLLIEASGMLGGMSTLGMVNAFPNDSDGIRTIYGGYAKKLLTAMQKESPEIVENGSAHWNSIDYEVLKRLYDKLITDSGAELLLNTRTVAVKTDGRNITALLAAAKDGLRPYRAKVFIDCTGDADIYAFAGQPVLKGDEAGGLQPGSLCFMIAGIDEDAFKKMNDPWYKGEGQKVRALLQKILDDGKYDIPDDHFVPRRVAPGIYTFNAGHIYDLDGTDPESVTAGSIEGRRLAHEFFAAYREYAPEAFGKAFLVETAAAVGIRETRRIVGDYTFTVEDYLARRSFPDEVFRGRYPVDVHETTKDNKNNTLLQFPHYTAGESYGVPYRILCPQGLDNLLVAGRAVSCDRMSNGSLRVMPCCICGGEAAGMAAAFAAREQAPNIHKVDTGLLRSRLREEGAYLP